MKGQLVYLARMEWNRLLFCDISTHEKKQVWLKEQGDRMDGFDLFGVINSRRRKSKVSKVNVKLGLDS